MNLLAQKALALAGFAGVLGVAYKVATDINEDNAKAHKDTELLHLKNLAGAADELITNHGMVHIDKLEDYTPSAKRTLLEDQALRSWHAVGAPKVPDDYRPPFSMKTQLANSYGKLGMETSEDPDALDGEAYRHGLLNGAFRFSAME